MRAHQLQLIVLALAPLLQATPLRELHSDAQALGDRWLAVSVPFKHALKPGDPTAPTRIPPTFPSIDQSLMITGALLDDPLVTDTMQMIRSTVPAALLNIPTSIYNEGSNVTYRGNPASTCYWPRDGCMRETDGNGYVADTFTCKGANQWGITYDDGPTSNIVNGKHTADSTEISDALTALGAHGTYFVTGSNAFQNPDVLVYLDKAGHQIGIHTWSHHPLTSLSNEQIVAEIKFTEAVIFRAIGKVPTYMRPPYGDVDDRVRAVVNAMGYHVALWDQDSHDASGQTSTAARNTALRTIESWFTSPTSFVSLEHDINTFTSSVAVEALKRFAQSGSQLKIVTMAECNGHIPYSFGGNGTSVNATTTVVPTTVVAPTALKTDAPSPTVTADIKLDPGVKKASASKIGASFIATAVMIGGLVLMV